MQKASKVKLTQILDSSQQQFTQMISELETISIVTAMNEQEQQQI